MTVCINQCLNIDRKVNCSFGHDFRLDFVSVPIHYNEFCPFMWFKLYGLNLLSTVDSMAVQYFGNLYIKLLCLRIGQLD